MHTTRRLLQEGERRVAFHARKLAYFGVPKLIPKPELHRVVSEVREQTQLALDVLESGVSVEAVRVIITRAVESGIEMQREALLGEDTDTLDTPLRPPSSDVPPPMFPRPSKLPQGVE
jgi:hypothetical protein